MRKKIIAEKWEIEVLKEIISKIFSSYQEKDTIQVCDSTGHCAGMCMDTFFENLTKELSE